MGHTLLPMSRKIRIAVDGYSSCGKSTLARALARTLGFAYIDSGAMYRAVTHYFLKHHIDLSDTEQVKKALEKINIDFDTDADHNQVLLNKENITRKIRQMPVSENVSAVSAIKEVRQAMVKKQQDIGKNRNVVMDGRDIGTTVFPNAQLKLFMTADPKIRAERRFNELILKGEYITFEEVYENLGKRDLQDTMRKESPLVKAPDAIVLDNTHLSESEQLDFVLRKYLELDLHPS